MSLLIDKTSLGFSANAPELMYSYRTLIGNRTIEVLRGKCLYGSVDGKGELELRGIPQELLSANRTELLRNFLETCYAFLEKGSDGEEKAVHLRPSLRGGTRVKIPFQPGLALGSVVKNDTLRKMEAYAEVTGKQEHYQMQIEEAEQRVDVLNAKIESYQNHKRGGTESGKALIAVWIKERESIQEKMIPALITALSKVSYESDFFVNFQTGLQSPIDTEKSQIEIQPRAFDSLSYNSQYIRMSESSSEIHDKLSQSSSSGSASVSVGGWFGKGKVSTSWARAAADRVIQIQKSDVAESVLVVNAFMTTRNVRTFTKIHYNYHTLRTIYDAMQKGDQQKLEEYGISQNGDSKEILILTEAVMGAGFTGIVTFLKDDKTRGKEEHHSRESQHTSAVSVSTPKFFGLGVSVGGNYSGQSASGSEDTVLTNLSNTRVNIEIFCQGAIPTFAREVIERELLKHVDLNPAKFELSSTDEKTVEDFLSGDVEKMQRAGAKQQIKMQNAAVGVLNACRGLKSVTEKEEVHTTHSVFTSYDNFARQIVADKECGVPIGFNYMVLNEQQIKELLEAEDQRVREQSLSSEGSSSDKGKGKAND